MSELSELSRRSAVDGQTVQLDDSNIRGGTLRRSGSRRFNHSTMVGFTYSVLSVFNITIICYCITHILVMSLWISVGKGVTQSKFFNLRDEEKLFSWHFAFQSLDKNWNLLC